MAFLNEDWIDGGMSSMFSDCQAKSIDILNSVPVIAIFTKFEWRVTKAYGHLRDEKMSMGQAKKAARSKAFADFDEIRQERFANVRHSPATWVYLQGILHSYIIYNKN